MPRYQIIVNPISGRGAGLASIPTIRQNLDALGVEYTITQTERPWHAAELTQQAVQDGYDVVVSVGGDGTANEVINGLVLAQKAGLGTAAMGVLAVGRGNDFAYSMYIPDGLEAGCQALVHGQRKKIDIGFVCGGDYPNGRYFGNGVGLGFDAVVGFVAVKMTRLTGFASYIAAVAKTIFLYFDAPTVKIETDRETITLPALMVSIMNGRRLGGGFMIAPQGDNADGLLDVCIVRQVSRGRVMTLIPHFLKGTQASQPEVSIIQAQRLEVTALKGFLPCHGDGETICERGDKIRIELLPAQIELICQPPKEKE